MSNSSSVLKYHRRDRVKPSLFVNSQEQILLVHLLKCARQITKLARFRIHARDQSREGEKDKKRFVRAWIYRCAYSCFRN